MWKNSLYVLSRSTKKVIKKMLSLPRATLYFEAPVENIAKNFVTCVCVQELEISRQTQMENALNTIKSTNTYQLKTHVRILNKRILLFNEQFEAT